MPGTEERNQQRPAAEDRAGRAAKDRREADRYISLGGAPAAGRGGPRGASSRGPVGPVALAAIAACCVALIVISLGFMRADSEAGWSLAWLLPQPAVSTEAARDPGSAEQGEGDDAQQGAGQPGQDAGTADDAEQDGGAVVVPGASTDDGASDTTASQSAAGDAADQGTGSSGAQEGGSPDAGQSATGGGSGSAQQGGGSADSSVSTSREPQHIAVSVSISSSAVGNPVSASGTVEVEAGATVYDALMALAGSQGISINASDTVFGMYVSNIGGLAEKAHGGQSGWVYTVNGQRINVSASSCTLSAGDSVQWSYVTSAS